jgi:rare lipoprotein A
MIRKQLLLSFAMLLLLIGCHRKSITNVTNTSCQQTGIASYYGGKFIGRLTANGEIYDANKLTAAHKTLPFGTMVKVTNLKNNKSVIVRINDRGPFVSGRIIDLSEAAAKKIEMLQVGIQKVEIECQ